MIICIPGNVSFQSLQYSSHTGGSMDEGRERDKTSRRGGLPMGPIYAAQSKAQYISAFATRVLLSTYV
jgi:hypothetical protein